jgi:hypothetical protein
MEFRTRSMSRVLDDLIEKLRPLPPEHPDRPRLVRMISDLHSEVAARPERAGTETRLIFASASQVLTASTGHGR